MPAWWVDYGAEVVGVIEVEAGRRERSIVSPGVVQNNLIGEALQGCNLWDMATKLPWRRSLRQRDREDVDECANCGKWVGRMGKGWHTKRFARSVGER